MSNDYLKETRRVVRDFLMRRAVAPDESRLIAQHSSLGTRVVVLFVCSFLLAVSTVSAQTPWDVGDTQRAGQWTLFGPAALGAALGLPLAAGDLNGDGKADVILTPMNAGSGPGRQRDRAGEAVIILSSGEISGTIDLSDVSREDPPDNVTWIFGDNNLDFFGTEVWVADVDGDGFDDAIVGAQQGDGPANARNGAGDVAIIWGNAAIGGAVIDLRSTSGPTVTMVYGAQSGDRLGTWVSAGDVDADGVMDVILGADQSDGPDNQRFHAGATYVLYGGAALHQRGEIDLATRDVPFTLIHGIDPEDHSGCTVRGVDLNGDAAADVLIGAGLNRLSASVDADGNRGAHASAGGDGFDNFTNNVGEAYIVYGTPGERPEVIDLRTPPASTAIIWGASANDAWGEELFGGDFNGDGFGDVLVGALTASGLQPSSANSGRLALILGSATLPGARIRLDQPPAGVTIFVGRRGSIAGDTALFADINADGKDDLVIGSPQAAPMSRVNAGIVDIFFGTATPFPAIIDLNSAPTGFTPYRLFGAQAGDMLAYSMALGDVDDDGVIDLVINAMGADGFADRLDRAGDAYVLSGPLVSAAAGQAIVTPTPTATSSPTPTGTVGLPACAGDCDGNNDVRVDELVRAVAIALERQPVTECRAGDRDGDGRIVVNELVLAVNVLLSGCTP